MNVVVLLNARAGSVAPQTIRDDVMRLRELFQLHGIGATVQVVPGGQLADMARRAVHAHPDAVVAGGGDGTISAVASALVDQPIPLGILPLGTLNHFARDLGIPADLEAAIRAIGAGHTRTVDVGQVNQRTFVNNSSIGLYPHVVRDRDEQCTRLGRGKWLAMFFAAVAALRRFPVVRVRIGIGGRSILRTTPFVFIGNNQYQVSLFNVRGRQTLDAGQLSLYVANRTGRFGMFRLALRAILGTLDQAKDFDSASLPELWIETGKRHLHVALDGEVTTLAPPLHYRSRARALTVIVPRTESDSPLPARE